MPYPDRPRILIDFIPSSTASPGSRGSPRSASAPCSCAPRISTRPRRCRLVTDALAATKGTRTRLVVNDYWRAAIAAGAKHLHLGQEDLAEADLKAIRNAGLTLGLSTHDDEELATALRAEPDYVALGPIFPTTLKSMRFAPQGIAEDHRVEKARRRHPAGRDRRHQARAGAPRSSPPAPIRSPSSATSPRTPTPTRGCAPGSDKTRRPREMMPIHRHCERSEAIHPWPHRRLDCFVAYAPRNDATINSTS